MEENCAAVSGTEAMEACEAPEQSVGQNGAMPPEENVTKERTAQNAVRLRSEAESEAARLNDEREQTVRERARLVAEEQVRQIGQLDGAVQSVDDLLSMPEYESFYALVKKGVSMVEAYKLTHYDALVQRAADAAARQTMRSLGSRRHLTSIAGQPGNGEYVSVPAEVAAEYRLAKPGITDGEIRSKYKKFQKYARQ